MSKKHFNFKSSIRDWYIRAFPSDELGYRINPLATFAGAVKCMADGGDIYKYLGVGDSLVRENVFSKIAAITGVDYDAVYGLWLHHDEDECSRLVFLGDHPDCAVDRDWREQFDEVVSPSEQVRYDEMLAAEEQRKAEEARLAAEKAEAEKAAQQNTLADTPSETKITTDYHLSLRANLLRWATLTPDLGVEWRICPSCGIAVNGSWTSWTWSDKDRRYALWEVAPEIRYYMGEKKAWYLGAMFKAGQFNYKISETGKQGDLMGGGITTGYQLRLNKALALDFNLGLGYLNADFEKYEVIDGVRVRRGNETKDWWGPINAGVTLVWKLF